MGSCSGIGGDRGKINQDPWIVDYICLLLQRKKGSDQFLDREEACFEGRVNEQTTWVWNEQDKFFLLLNLRVTWPGGRVFVSLYPVCSPEKNKTLTRQSGWDTGSGSKPVSKT